MHYCEKVYHLCWAMSVYLCQNFTCSKYTSKTSFCWTQSCHPQSLLSSLASLISFSHFKLSATYCLLSIFLYFFSLWYFFHLTEVKAFAVPISLLLTEECQVLQIPKTFCNLEKIQRNCEVRRLLCGKRITIRKLQSIAGISPSQALHFALHQLYMIFLVSY